jgi:hypothetical protein
LGKFTPNAFGGSSTTSSSIFGGAGATGFGAATTSVLGGEPTDVFGSPSKPTTSSATANPLAGKITSKKVLRTMLHLASCLIHFLEWLRRLRRKESFGLLGQGPSGREHRDAAQDRLIQGLHPPLLRRDVEQCDGGGFRQRLRPDIEVSLRGQSARCPAKRS